MSEIKEAELYQNFSKEFDALMSDKQPVILEMSKLQAWVLLCQIQLALRHPKNIGPTSKLVKDLALELQNKIATTPALATVAGRGWDTKFDTEPEEI